MYKEASTKKKMVSTIKNKVKVMTLYDCCLILLSLLVIPSFIMAVFAVSSLPISPSLSQETLIENQSHSVTLYETQSIVTIEKIKKSSSCSLDGQHRLFCKQEFYVCDSGNFQILSASCRLVNASQNWQCKRSFVTTSNHVIPDPLSLVTPMLREGELAVSDEYGWTAFTCPQLPLQQSEMIIVIGGLIGCNFLSQSQEREISCPPRSFSAFGGVGFFRCPEVSGVDVLTTANCTFRPMFQPVRFLCQRNEFTPSYSNESNRLPPLAAIMYDIPNILASITWFGYSCPSRIEEL